MTERDWELYRLSVVEQMPESLYRDAIIAGISHKLFLLDRLASSGDPDGILKHGGRTAGRTFGDR
jgi:hypothetical protein